jgi:hypothetical protein
MSCSFKGDPFTSSRLGLSKDGDCPLSDSRRTSLLLPVSLGLITQRMEIVRFQILVGPSLLEASTTGTKHQ